MKYIRTKDDVFELKLNEEDIVNGTHYHVTDNMYERDYMYNEEDIVKQADTIEELCDKFVMVHLDNDTAPDFFWDKPVLQNGYEINKDYEIYAAIWTEWGLKYVAKMNEKGELELL